VAKATAPKFPGLPNTGEAVQRVTTKSVMSPYLIFSGIALPTLMPALLFTTGAAQMMAMVLIGLIVITVMGALIYFSAREPDRLQSEEYRTEMRRIDILGRPGMAATTIDIEAEQTPNYIAETEKLGEIDER
jgi:small-conductance mechanosensitive channel